MLRDNHEKVASAALYFDRRRWGQGIPLRRIKAVGYGTVVTAEDAAEKGGVRFFLDGVLPFDFEGSPRGVSGDVG
jgi:hypothetical protein